MNDVETFQAHRYDSTEGIVLMKAQDVHDFYKAICIDEKPVIVAVSESTTTLVMPSVLSARIRSGEFAVTSGDA